MYHGLHVCAMVCHGLHFLILNDVMLLVTCRMSSHLHKLRGMCPATAAGLEVWSFLVVEIRPYLVEEIYCLAISFTPLVSCPDNTRKRKGLVAFATLLGAVCKIRKKFRRITYIALR